MRLSPTKIKFMVFNRSRTTAPCYGNLNLGGAELEKVKSLRILEVVRSQHILEVLLDSKLTFEAHLGKVVLNAARSLGQES